VPREQARAFAPGRVNLIGEHTDYNQGLALPFAIAEGITVDATARDDERIVVRALDRGEQDEFALLDPPRAPGWRAFVRGMVAELRRAGFPVTGAELEIRGEIPQGAGLSSSAALEVALCLALLALTDSYGSGSDSGPGSDSSPGSSSSSGSGSGSGSDRLSLARLCSRVESEWAGARTGLLDQLASLYGAPATALRIDFQTLAIEPVPLRLRDGWRLVTLDSGERHVNASSAYNERRAECADACKLLGIASLREAGPSAIELLPERLRRRARHVYRENVRVDDTVAALRADEPSIVGELLNASHASLRDDYEVSTAAVEAAVETLLETGAAGARIVGGGFGGHVLGLLPPDVYAPPGAREVRAGKGAQLLDR
jgi:galactokinase